ncbi:large-conductance mechanosensitive channel [Porphyromonadaceae bacterium COT-184 OH4590]|nr:large-conductance mechanosensitive channel [Porphyromonadaceae bacterium COT-184 OH4590]MDO4725618.1 large-conductance mechanosensitive channel protein MscL [Porphyromonadaceae bacterium]
MKILQEFKDFAVKGNVIDMAVGIIIGGAFGKIVSSLVNDIIMPPIGMLLGGINFDGLKYVLKSATVDAAGVAVPEVSINYGSFIQVTVDFLIIALCIFFFIKMINNLKKTKEEKPAATPPAEPTKEEVLLTEIRDILKNK